MKIPESRQEQLAAKLRQAREYLNLSQQFVAEQTGIPRAAISAIECGKRKVDSLELELLAKLYKYSVSYFLQEQDEEDQTIQALTRAARELTSQDREEMLRFATFLKHYGERREQIKPGTER